MVTLPYLPAKAHGGILRSQRLWVCHSTQGPMSRGNARALAGPNWFGGPAGTSAHTIFDPREGIEMVKPNIVAYHVGPGANGFTLGGEHCGKVEFTKAQWLSPDGVSMLRLSAEWTAQTCHRFDIDPVWGKLPELAGGRHCMCTHNDIRLVFGGTTHSDPGPNFPYGEYQEWTQEFYYGTSDSLENIVAQFYATKAAFEAAITDAASRALQDAIANHGNTQTSPSERAFWADHSMPSQLAAIEGRLEKALKVITSQAQTNGGLLSTLKSEVDQLKAAVDALAQPARGNPSD